MQKYAVKLTVEAQSSFGNNHSRSELSGAATWNASQDPLSDRGGEVQATAGLNSTVYSLYRAARRCEVQYSKESTTGVFSVSRRFEKSR